MATPTGKARRLTLDELAASLGVDRTTLQRWRVKGGMPTVLDGRYRLVVLGDFLNWSEQEGSPGRHIVRQRIQRAQARGDLRP
jgi:excisionase family DNA binding protein